MANDSKTTTIKPVAFSKLKGLKCFKIVHKHLVDGWPLTEVARIIQEDHQEYTEVTKSGLVAMLHKYKATIPPVEMAEKVITQDHLAALKKVEEGIDELAELTKLYKIQMERVGLDLTLEKNMKKMLNTTGQEVRIAKEILGAISELKMDLGLNDRHLGKTETSTTTTQILLHADVSPDARKVLDNPDGRRKLLGVAQRLLASAGGLKDPITVTATPSNTDPNAHVFTDTDSKEKP